MPLFEVETTSHIMIACVADEPTAREFRGRQLSERGDHPGDASSARRLGDFQEAAGHPVAGRSVPVARDCLSKAAGDKLHAMRLYMQTTGSDLEGARKVIESNMVLGW